MESTAKDRTIAAIVAVAVHAVVLLTFCITYLTWPPEEADSDRLPDDESEILFVNDYVNLGDMLTPEKPADAPKLPSEGESLSDATDIENDGEPATAPAVVATEQPSPAKARPKPVPEKQGPTKEELEAAAKAKAEQAARERIKNQMNFGGKGKGEGVSGTSDGTAVSGSPDGKAGHDLAGRTIVSWGRNSSRKTGTVQIAITVNYKGEVTSARYAGGTGAASGDASIRENTIKAARATKFSALPEGSPDQKGIITWRFT